MISCMLQNLHHIELDREIDNEADDKSALTHEVRQQREAVVLGDLLAVERDESAHWSGRRWHRICRSNTATTSTRSPLLGVRLVTAPRVNPSPGTTPGHSFDMRR